MSAHKVQLRIGNIVRDFNAECGIYIDGKFYDDEIAAQAKTIRELTHALKLIFEVHPTQNTKEDYVEAVRKIAFKALQ